MAYATPPYSAYLDVVLVALRQLAMSPAMATEIATYKSYRTSAEPFNLNITDAAGAVSQINVAPADGVNLSYIAPSFQTVTTGQLQKNMPPLPQLFLVGMPGRLQVAQSGSPFRDESVEGDIFAVHAVVFGGTSDDPIRAQEEAIVLAQCFRSLVRRNEHLNGLVQLIQPVGPTEPNASLAPWNPGTTVPSARVRFEVYSLVY